MNMISQQFQKPSIPTPSRTPLLNSLFRFLVLGGFLFLTGSSIQAIELTVDQTPGGPGKDYTLSWTAATKSTDTSETTYYIYSEFGLDDVETIPGNLVGTKLEELTIKLRAGSGTRGFVVVSSDSFDGRSESSLPVYHNFIHVGQANGGGAVLYQRTDGDGTHRGFNQIWKFSYQMDTDAYVTMRVYPPGTTFLTDANEFVTGASGGVNPIKTLVENTPRSGELLDGSVFASDGDDVWDSRNSSGAIVGNGIYYVLLQATLDPGQSGYAVSPLRYGEVLTIPVDILRIINLSATGISISNPTSLISYTLTGDANVRIVIARPGSGFVVDSNGDIQPYNLNTLAIDQSLVVSTRTFQRKAGTNVESWDGTSSTGAVMTSGVYAVGISASDEFGNHAVDSSGNDFPIFATITLERSVGSDSGSSTASDTTPPTVQSISPSDGSSSNAAISTITIVLADDESTLNLSGTSVIVRGPNTTTIPGTITTSGSDTLIFTPTTELTTSGQYTVQVTALDNAGNSATYSLNFSIDIRLESSALESSMSMFPNPAKNTTAYIRYSLSVAASVEVEVFNIMGEKVYSVVRSRSQGQFDEPWNLVNNSGQRVGSGLYLVRVKAKGSSGDAEAVKKLVVVQ